jgi:hypothetical protein
MNYPFENLGDERFQQLCQALLAKANPGVQCFPVGQPDGGRDATQRNLTSTKKDSFLVYQVKFVRDPAAQRNPREWLLKIVEGEIEKVRALVDRSATGYFLITNVRGSSHLDNGSIDQMQDLLSEKLDLPAVCWWRDDLERRLDDAWDIKWAYPDVLTGSDFLRAVCEMGLKQDMARRESALRAFLRDQYNRDSQVKFRQIDLQNGLLDLFVDVPIAAGQGMDRSTAPDAFEKAVAEVRADEIRAAQAAAENAGVPAEYGHNEVGTASFLLSRLSCTFEWVVLEGGPGQGKSTISQYVAQVHRIRLLDISADRDRLALDHAASPIRLPIRIDLRDFAQWLRQENPFSGSPLPLDKTGTQLEPFIASLISYHAGSVRFTVDDLIAVAQISAVCLVLDGLDEIADIPTRSLAVAEIAAGCQRLLENAASLQVVVTSRPAIFSDTPRLTDARFAYVRLASLNRRLIQAYVELWGRARRVSPDVQEEFREFIRTKLDQPHIKELARNPMQLSILLSLVNARGVALPEKRTALYDAYIEHFLARESEKNVTIRTYRELILDLHKYVAWVMHSEAEEKGNRGSIQQQRLVSLLRDYLEWQGNDPAIAGSLFKDMVDRVFVLVSRAQGAFEFEVQPLREYFAARFLFDTAPLSTTGNERAGAVPDRFEAMAPRAYWMNVSRFFAGCYSKGELQSLIVSLQGLYEDRDIGLTNLPAYLSMALLSDWVFNQVPRQVSLVGRQLAEGDRLLRLSVDAFVMPHDLDESVFASADETVALQIANKCFDELESELPSASRWPLSRLIQANSKSSAQIGVEWLRRCSDCTETQFTMWLRVGRMAGLLSELSMEQLSKLPIAAEKVHVLELFNAGQEEFLETRVELFDQAVQLLLRSELGETLRTRTRTSPLGVLCLGLTTDAYVYVSRRPLPMSMGEAIQRYEGGSTLQLHGWKAPDSHSSHMRSIEAFAEVLDTQLARPVKDWASSLSPWTELTTIATAAWGEVKAVRLFGILAAGAKTGGRASSRYADLLDIRQPICERTRFARLSARNADYWSTQFRNAATNDDRLFAAAVAIAWCPFETLLSVIDQIGTVLESLNVEDWYWLANRTRYIRWACGFRDQEGKLKRGILPTSVTPRAACTMAELTSGSLRREIVTRYMADISDPIVDRYRLWLATDILRFGKKQWSPDLAVISELYRRDVYLADGYDLVYSRKKRANRMSASIARKILTTPRNFPPELVHSAEKSMREHMTARSHSLAEAARRAGWFDDMGVHASTRGA